ncbi:MAG: gamma-glutamyltransferase [Chloroflexi bacterium]|nr:gamma-glutamyltransferase [Chloroflexota bacterium]
MPVAALLSDSYAAARFAQIDPQQAQPPAAGQPSRHGDTVYLTVADKEGNMVSWIQSLYMGFGSGLTADATGSAAAKSGEPILRWKPVTPMKPRPANGRSTPLSRLHHQSRASLEQFWRDGRFYAAAGSFTGGLKPGGNLTWIPKRRWTPPL